MRGLSSSFPDWPLLLVCAVPVAAVAAGCRGHADRATKPTRIERARFDPPNFGDPARGANPYLPVVPGSQWVREGFTDVGRRRVPIR